MVGACLVYAISGILLNHMGEKDPAFKTEEKSLQLEPGLSQEELMAYWTTRKDLPAVKKIFSVDEDHSRLMLEGGIGIYDRQTGRADYEKHTKREFIYWINRLHYNKVKGWNIMADFFAASLIFFAVSGLLIVRGETGRLRPRQMVPPPWPAHPGCLCIAGIGGQLRGFYVFISLLLQ
jgi:hypothetical protein